MKKVLFTATVDSHILHFHLPYLKMFKENGYEVHVATNGDEEIPYCDVKHKISFERSPFKINNLKAIKDLKKIIDKEKFDIIHTHTPMGSVVTRLAAKESRKNGTRVIYTAHGFHFYKGAPIINWLLFYPVEKYLSKYTDTLITINNEDYERAKKKFKKCKDIQYVPGVGVDPEKFNMNMSKEEKNELRKSLGIKENDFVIIYVAELNKNKNQIMAIKVMEKLLKEKKNIKLLLVGKGIKEKKYKELAKKLGLEKNILFTGYRKDIPQLLHISNLAISCSKREGLGLNLIEAQMTEIPLVAVKNRGHIEIVLDGYNGFLCDQRNLNMMSKLIMDKYILHNIPIKNKDYINKFSIKNIIEKMKTIYFGNE